MSLLQLWEASPEQIRGKRLHQLIAFAGEGKLRDGSDASQEFRAFLARIPSAMLISFVDECLNASFPDSGFSLQDVINEVGRRLGFVVTNGSYQGRQGNVGFDGLWTLPTAHSLVVEVKTTDAYRIDTDRLAGYRKELAEVGKLTEAASSVLLVVGRQDTGDLEAQIRGSRHAWDIRLISTDALLRLMSLKETLDDPQTITRICEILIPKEYTRLDEIVNLVFSAAEEIQHDELEAVATESDQDSVEPGERPVAFHDACVAHLAKREGLPLVRQSRSKYIQPDGEARVVCAVSKQHRHQGRTSYWFAFHPHQDEFLGGRENAYLVLGCGSPDRVLAIPHARVREWLDDLWTTERDDGRRYWHIRLQQDGDKLWLDRRKGKGRLAMSEFLVR